MGKMQGYASFEQFLRFGQGALAKGPVALIFAEDAVEIASSVRHHLDQGFASVVLFLDSGVTLPQGLDDPALHVVSAAPTHASAVAETVTRVQRNAPENTWFYWCYNAEYLFFPFCETRRVGEMLAFHAEERRRAMLSFVIDLYAPEITKGPVCIKSAMMDRTGYYALARAGEGGPKDRQLDFFGGLRWRFEEHIPKTRRRIDRVALFRSRTSSLHMRPDATFSEEEYNTYQCQWHHNLSCVVASFRTAKALVENPGSRHAIQSFKWRNSVPFEWSSRQLMGFGLMEPGQWF